MSTDRCDSVSLLADYFNFEANIIISRACSFPSFSEVVCDHSGHDMLGWTGLSLVRLSRSVTLV